MQYYYVEIDENLEDETGVFFNSIVDVPAHLRQVHKFSKPEIVQGAYAVTDEDQQIVTGVMIAANQPIYRNDDELGEHYVIFRPEAIRAAIHKFHRLKLTDQMNLNHDHEQIVDGCYMFESFQVNRELGINPPKNLKNSQLVKDGSWIASYKITDSNTWKQVKDGDYSGFSVEVAYYLNPAKVKKSKSYSRELKAYTLLQYITKLNKAH